MSSHIVESVPIDTVRVPDRHRGIKSDAVSELASSLEKIGLKTPLTVKEEYDGSLTVIAGAHRLAAARSLGWPSIDVCVVDWSEAEAEMWEISENLHRAELTALERSEHIEHWRTLAKGAQVAHPGGNQPSNQGVSATARDLNVSRREVERSEKIAGISEDAKDAAREVGLDDNQSALLKVAKEPKKKQKAKVYNLSDLRKGNIPDEDVNQSMAWRGRFRRFWDQAPDATDREWALQYVMDIAPVFDQTKAGAHDT